MKKAYGGQTGKELEKLCERDAFLFYWAVKEAREDIFKEVLIKRPFLVLQDGFKKRNIVHAAIYSQKTECLDILFKADSPVYKALDIEQKVELLTDPDADKDTPLHIAYALGLPRFRQKLRKEMSKVCD